MTVPNRLPVLLLPLLLFGAQASAQTEPVPEPPLPEKIETPPLPGDEPAVTIRQIDNGDIVEEYRTGGMLTEIRVRPANGVPYTLLANQHGRFTRRDQDGPIAPVYFTLYEWD